jgi:hypothetical protein
MTDPTQGASDLTVTLQLPPGMAGNGVNVRYMLSPTNNVGDKTNFTYVPSALSHFPGD